MDRLADIIPIVSRRRVEAPVRAQRARQPVRSPGGVVALVGAGLLFVAIVALSGLDFGGKIRDLPPGLRGELYRRSLGDAESACALPAAGDGGALHEHCLEQARFLLLFPECDAHCRTLATSILPRAHR
jgi:hypothetical protein